MHVSLNIIVEGQTEEAFVNQILKPHLDLFCIDVSARVVVTKRVASYTYKGGLNCYSQAKEISLLAKP